MRTIWTALVLTTLIVGCKKEPPKADDNAVMGSASGAAKPADEMKPEPVAKEAPPPATPPAATPPAPSAASEDTVHPPAAADLAEYTKDLPGNGPLTATIETNMGAFHCKLFADKAPATVANFVGLATGKKAWSDPRTNATQKGKPYFNGLTFHRVIPKFMIQGGDPLGEGTGGPGYEFDDEVNNGLTMQEGTLAMANAGQRPGGGGTNGSQFFITEVATTFLNNKHTIFGQCKEVDLVKQIARVPTDPSNNKPNSPVTITKITIARG